MPMRISSFPPIVTPNAKLLILGTMPGAMSLVKQEYYGYKQNHFWRIMFTIFGDGSVPELFSERKLVILKNGLAVWDVLAHCEREGSLDVNIRNQEENDIPGLLADFPNIKTILFNGKESHRFFTRKFPEITGIDFHVMPSTSPANTMRFENKLSVWQEALIRALKGISRDIPVDGDFDGR